ncbi:MAG: PorT family protein [Bacteroidales bacterium]|nr:PorT family protein [Bacteroidales bacterium]
MEKRISAVVVLLLIFSSISVNAQLYLGVKGGLNVSSFTGYDDLVFADASGMPIGNQETDFIPSFHIGGMLQYQFYDSFFIQPEIFYSRQGTKIKGLGEKTTVHLDYLQIPIYGGYKYRTGDELFLIGGIGPYFAYGLDGRYDFFEYHKRFDIGLTFMAGVQINSLQIAVAFDWGLKDIRKERDIMPYRSDEGGSGSIESIPDVVVNRNYRFSAVRNQNLKLSVAYLFEMD